MINKAVFLQFLWVLILFGVTQMSAAESSPQFIQGSDTLIVYTNVPGLEPSEFYNIRVRSAATIMNGSTVLQTLPATGLICKIPILRVIIEIILCIQMGGVTLMPILK